jgi:hypothetical protein
MGCLTGRPGDHPSGLRFMFAFDPCAIAGTRYGTLAHPGAGPGADRVPEPSGVYLAAASDRTGYVESLAAL